MYMVVGRICPNFCCLGIMSAIRKSPYLEPAHVEKELKESEERKDEVAAVTAGRTLFQRLATHQTGQKEQVHRHRHYLHTATRLQIRVLKNKE